MQKKIGTGFCKKIKDKAILLMAVFCAFCTVGFLHGSFFENDGNICLYDGFVMCVHADEQSDSSDSKGDTATAEKVNEAIIYLRGLGYNISELDKNGKYTVTDTNGNESKKSDVALCQYASLLSTKNGDGKYSFKANSDGSATWNGQKYDKTGKTENFLLTMYTAKVKIFGEDIDFSDLSKTLSRFLEYSDFEKININASNSNSVNLYKFFKDVIWTAIKAICTVLCTVMFLWRLIKEGMEVERFSVEKFLMMLARLIMLNMFITYSWQILGIFFHWVMQLMDVFDFGADTYQVPATNIGYVFATAITESKNILKGVYFIIGFGTVLMYYATATACIVKVVVRYVKVLFGLAISPVPFALCMDRDYGNDAIRVLLMICGLFIQAPLMKVSLSFYNFLVAEFASSVSAATSIEIGTIIPMCIGIGLLNALLSALFSMSEEFTERLFV